MTYTIIGRCPETHRLGLGITTFSLAVGGYCPYVRADVAALSTQAYANSRLGAVAMELLQAGASTDRALADIAAQDPHIDYRQIGIVGTQGDGAAWTGEKVRPYGGHLVGPGFVAMGNSLSGERVVRAIADAFEQSRGLELEERLLRALEAGRDAGGQSSSGEHLPERSAALIVHEPDGLVPLDLRIDIHDNALDELRKVHAAYKPYVAYYGLRASDPPNTPAQDVWMAQNQIADA